MHDGTCLICRVCRDETDMGVKFDDLTGIPNMARWKKLNNEVKGSKGGLMKLIRALHSKWESEQAAIDKAEDAPTVEDTAFINKGAVDFDEPTYVKCTEVVNDMSQYVNRRCCVIRSACLVL